MPARPEFSRTFHADRIGPAGRTERLTATPEERAALARRFGIESVNRLEAEVTLTPEPGGTVRARGRLDAEVTQACVVSFEPVAQRIAEAVDLRFVPPGEESAESVEPEAPDEVEMTPAGLLDLGEALAEQVALALDPYPRAEGAALPPEARDAAEDGTEAAAGAPRPFAALARLRKERG